MVTSALSYPESLWCAYHGLDRRMWHGIELFKRHLVVRANVDEGSPILCHVAVFRGREHCMPSQMQSLEIDTSLEGAHTCDALPVVFFLVAVHAHLVTADDRIEAVALTEALRDVGPKLHSHATLAGPSARLGLGIGPQHLHHETRLSRLALLVSIQLPDIVQGDVVVREQATMEDKILGSNERC